MLKRIVRFILKRSFLLWVFYIIIISVYSVSITPRRSHILIIPQKNPVEYNIIFKSYTGEYSLSSTDTYFTDVYVSFKNEKQIFKLEIEGKIYTSENNLVHDAIAAQEALRYYPAINSKNFYRITNLPAKSFFKISKKAPFLKSYQIINYSYWEIIVSIFSPLLLFTIAAFVARKRLFSLFNSYQSNTAFVNFKKLSPTKTFLDYISLTVIILCIFLFIEHQSPYYFLQDDSFAQFFPYLCRGMETFYKEGSIPLYNFLQLNGTADFGYTTYSYLNPVLHISYGLSFLLGNKFLLLDIYAFLNILLSALLVNAALIKLAIRQSVRFAAIINISFSGFILITGCSWYYLMPYLLFTSLIFFIAVKVRDVSFSFTTKQALYIGVIFGAFIYFGNIQYWVYCMLFFLLVFFTICFSYHRNHLKTAVFFLAKALLLSLIIGAPLIIMGMLETANTFRLFKEGFSIYPYLWNLFGDHFNSASLPGQWGTAASQKYHSHFYNIGLTGFLGIAASVIFFSLALSRFRKNQQGFNHDAKDQHWIIYLAAINILFLLLAIGTPGIISQLQGFVPFLNKFQLAFKYLLFIVFLSNIIGACLLNAFTISTISKIRRIYIDVALYTLSAVFMLLHLQGINYGFYSYSHSQNKVYDDTWILKDTGNVYLNKYISLSLNRSEKSYYTNSLMHNFSTAFNLFSVNGYEPLNPKFLLQNALIYKMDTLKKKGVNRLIVWKEPFEANNKYNLLYDRSVTTGFINPENLIFANDRISIYRINGADPLLFYYQKGNAVNDLKLTRNVGGSSVTFNLSEPVNADSMVVNFDYHKRLGAYINRQKVDKKYIDKDNYNRVIINTTKIKNIKTVRLEYSYFH